MQQRRGEIVVVSPTAEQLNSIAELLAGGSIKPHVAATFSLSEAATAQELVESGHVCGKAVLEIK